MIELPENQKAIIDEIQSKIIEHEQGTHDFLKERELFLNMYRGVAYPSSRVGTNLRIPAEEGLARTTVPTTAEAVETLTNAIYTMLTAADPNFELTSSTGKINSSLLFKNTQLLRIQDDQIKFKRKLMIAIRSLVLNGTSFVEQPYISFPYNESNPSIEATDFVPRSWHQMFWMPSAVNLDYSDFMGTLDILSPGQLYNFSQMDPDQSTWMPANIQEALSKSEDEGGFVAPEVRTKLTSLGYKDFKKNLELAVYWGPLESIKTREDYVVGIVNRKFLVRFHPSPYPRGIRPFRIAHHIETEDQPLGIGVGHQMKYQQKWINTNINRTMDVITFGLFNMMIASKFAGIDPRKMRIRPWSIIEADDINAIREFKPDLQSAAMGIKLHEILVEQARNHTGATPTLQAVITEASASEVRIAQNNSIRRVSNEAEIIAHEFIRERIKLNQLNNALFLDRPIWLKAADLEDSMMMFPSEVLKNVNVQIKIVTDKDFAPQMIKNSLQLLQILTSIRNMIPEDVDVRPIVAEVVRRLGVDPSKVFIPKPPVPQINPQAILGLLNKERGLTQPPTSIAESVNESLGGLNGMER